jgi:hypothetical protein
LLALAGAVAVAGLVAGVSALFRLAFTTGDHFPEYSTYRSDPRGCRAVFEALERTAGGGGVSRNLTPFPRLRGAGDSTVVLAGYQGAWLWGLKLPVGEIEALEAVPEAGGRLVIALNAGRFGVVDEAQLASRPPGTGGGEGADEEGAPLVGLDERWGFDVWRSSEAVDPEGGWGCEPGPALGPEPPPVPRWFSAFRARDAGGEWEVVLDTADGAAALRRSFGAGEIVFLTDAYFLCNQAVATAPATGFIRWVTSGRGRLVFDETHLGSATDPGIAGMVRRYRLHGFFLGLLVLGAVYMWKNASGLVPPDAATEGRRFGDAAVRGADATTGFGRLLRRHVPARSLLSTCYRTWFASRARGPSFTAAVADEVIRTIEAEEAKPARHRDLAAAYNAVARAVKAKR